MVGSFLAMIGVILLAIRNRQKNAAHARVFIEALSIEKAETAAKVIVPIIEVATPKLATETGELMENEDRFGKGEEIPHSMFIKHLKENRGEHFRVEVYHLDEDKLDEQGIIEKVE